MEITNPPALRPFMELRERLSAGYEAFTKVEQIFRQHEKMEMISNHASVDKYLDTFRLLDTKAIIGMNVAIDYAGIAKLPTIMHELFDRQWDDEDAAQENQTIRRIYIDEGKRLRGIIQGIYKDNREIMKISPREFEEIVAELMRSQGFEIELTKATRDGGYDIRAIKTIAGQYPLLFLVECKQYREDRKIGVQIVRAFREVLLHEGANKGLLVGTSYFTEDAKKKQRETPWLLEYRDKDDLMDWVANYTLRNGLYLPN